jgi:hypothetical protein
MGGFKSNWEIMGIYMSGWWLSHPSEKYELVNGKDYPIYYGKIKMFLTTNQMWTCHVF